MVISPERTHHSPQCDLDEGVSVEMVPLAVFSFVSFPQGHSLVYTTTNEIPTSTANLLAKKVRESRRDASYKTTTSKQRFIGPLVFRERYSRSTSRSHLSLQAILHSIATPMYKLICVQSCQIVRLRHTSIGVLNFTRIVQLHVFVCGLQFSYANFTSSLYIY